MLLFLKYFFNSLFISIAVFLVLVAKHRFTHGEDFGGSYSLQRTGIAVTLGVSVFIFMLLLFPVLMRIERKRNPHQKITMTALYAAQFRILKDIQAWMSDRIFWILGGIVALAVIAIMIDSLQ